MDIPLHVPFRLKILKTTLETRHQKNKCPLSLYMQFVTIFLEQCISMFLCHYLNLSHNAFEVSCVSLQCVLYSLLVQNHQVKSLNHQQICSLNEVIIIGESDDGEEMIPGFTSRCTIF